MVKRVFILANYCYRLLPRLYKGLYYGWIAMSWFSKVGSPNSSVITKVAEEDPLINCQALAHSCIRESSQEAFLKGKKKSGKEEEDTKEENFILMRTRSKLERGEVAAGVLKTDYSTLRGKRRRPRRCCFPHCQSRLGFLKGNKWYLSLKVITRLMKPQKRLSMSRR